MKLFGVEKLIYPFIKKDNARSGTVICVDKLSDFYQDSNFEKEKKPTLLRDLAQKVVPFSSKPQNQMQKALTEFDQFLVKQNKKDKILVEQTHLHQTIESDGFFGYRVFPFFIENILSAFNTNGLKINEQVFIARIFLQHISYLIKNDPKINQDEQLLEKYKKIQSELQNTSDLTDLRDRRNIAIEFENGLINKEEAVSKIEESINRETEKISRAIQTNVQYLVRFNLPGHALLIEFEQEKDDSGSFNGKYTVRIFNSGIGMENHSSYTDPLAKNKKNWGQLKFDTCFTVSHIDQEYLKEEDFKYLLNLSVHPPLRSNSNKEVHISDPNMEKYMPTDLAYSFFKKRGKEEKTIVHSSQSAQKSKNCTTRCFNAFLYQRLNGPGEYDYLMATFHRKLRENNPMSPEFIELSKKKEEKHIGKAQIAIHQKNYMEKMQNKGIPLVQGSQRFKNKDRLPISAEIFEEAAQTLYYQKDSGNLFLIQENNGNVDGTTYHLNFSSDQEEPKMVLLDNFLKA